VTPRRCDDAESARADVGEGNADDVQSETVLERDKLTACARDDADDSVQERFVGEVHATAVAEASAGQSVSA
jgi:hypothetical protein